MLHKTDKYKRAIVFSGGGTRFAIYCGMYEALSDLGCTPDLIIGACGGAVATALIKVLPDSYYQKEYLKSEEFYQFVKNTRLTEERYLRNIGLLCLRKMFNQKNAPYCENVFDRYLVDMDVEVMLPTLYGNVNNDVASVIIGSKLLFEKQSVGEKRNKEKLYRKVLFTDSYTASLIDQKQIRIESDNYLKSAVDSSIEIKTNVSIPKAMRISVSDMFYVPPVLLDGDYYAGGAIDLLPIELVKSLSDYAIMEKKENTAR